MSCFSLCKPLIKPLHKDAINKLLSDIQSIHIFVSRNDISEKNGILHGKHHGF